MKRNIAILGIAVLLVVGAVVLLTYGIPSLERGEESRQEELTEEEVRRNLTAPEEEGSQEVDEEVLRSLTAPE